MEQIDEYQDERMSKIEKAIDRLACEMALLRQHVDSELALLRQHVDNNLAAMKQYIDSSIATLRLEMQLYVQAEIQKAVDKLTARIDAAERRQMGFNRWMIGLLVSILVGQAALLVHGLLG